MLTIEVIKDFNSFVNLKSDWNNLLSKSDCDVPYLTHEWLTTWWECFGDKNELLILLVKKNNNLIAAAPLMISETKKYSLKLRHIGFIGNDLCYRLNFLLTEVPETSLEKIFDSLIKECRWDLIELINIPTDSSGYKLTKYLFNNKYHRQIFYGEKESLITPYIKTNGHWNEYLSQLNNNFIKNLRWNKNRLQKLGANLYQYNTKNKTHSLQQILADIFEIAKNTWQYQKGTSIVSTTCEKKFYTLLSQRFDESYGLYLSLLKKGGNGISFRYEIKYNEKLYNLKIGYDQQYKMYSPGIVLQALCFEEWFKIRLSEIDMGGTLDSAKKHWTKLTKEHRNILIFKKYLFPV